jgi:hypothetical protein|tara:strand:- start:90 stop:584 length:495 start_codon:yes stop_codon:yes gene_type:complete
MQRDELANQLKNQNFNTVLPSAFLQVGNPVFPDDSSQIALNQLHQIIEAYRSIHLPTYGTPIPGTGATVGLVGAGDLLAALGNEVYYVQAIHLSNGGGAPITVNITLGGVPINSSDVGTVGPSPETKAIVGPFYVDSGLPLKVAVSDGTASDLTTKVVYVKVVQ